VLQILSSSEVLTGVARLGMDVLGMLLLIGWLYRRRIAAPEMALVFTALNIGLFAALNAITAGHFPAGVGFGLFGLLSLVRLRSAAFTLKDVAYTFVALVLALVNGLPERGLLLPAALDVVLLVAVWLVDDSRRIQPSRVMRLTLDRVFGDLESVSAEVRRRLDVVPLSVVLEDVDFVRETTRVSVRYAVPDAWWQWADADAEVQRGDGASGSTAGAVRS
jgi:Domain of unknown function (DUF4956)